MKQVIQIIGICMTVIIAIMLIFVVLPYNPMLAIPILALPTLYIMYRLVQITINETSLNDYERSLTAGTSFLWLEVVGKLHYPLSSIISVYSGISGRIVFALLHIKARDTSKELGVLHSWITLLHYRIHK